MASQATEATTKDAHVSFNLQTEETTATAPQGEGATTTTEQVADKGKKPMTEEPSAKKRKVSHHEKILGMSSTAEQREHAKKLAEDYMKKKQCSKAAGDFDNETASEKELRTELTGGLMSPADFKLFLEEQRKEVERRQEEEKDEEELRKDEVEDETRREKRKGGGTAATSQDSEGTQLSFTGEKAMIRFSSPMPRAYFRSQAMHEEFDLFSRRAVLGWRHIDFDFFTQENLDLKEIIEFQGWLPLFREDGPILPDMVRLAYYNYNKRDHSLFIKKHTKFLGSSEVEATEKIATLLGIPNTESLLNSEMVTTKMIKKGKRKIAIITVPNIPAMVQNLIGREVDPSTRGINIMDLPHHMRVLKKLITHSVLQKQGGYNDVTAAEIEMLYKLKNKQRVQLANHIIDALNDTSEKTKGGIKFGSWITKIIKGLGFPELNTETEVTVSMNERVTFGKTMLKRMLSHSHFPEEKKRSHTIGIVKKRVQPVRAATIRDSLSDEEEEEGEATSSHREPEKKDSKKVKEGGSMGFIKNLVRSQKVLAEEVINLRGMMNSMNRKLDSIIDVLRIDYTNNNQQGKPNLDDSFFDFSTPDTSQETEEDPGHD